MQAQTDFKQALERCGFTSSAADEVQIHGIETIDDLGLLTPDGVKDTVKTIKTMDRFTATGDRAARIVISATAEVKLLGMLAWVRSHQRRGLTVVPNQFHDALVQEWAIKARDLDESRRKDDSDELVKPPREFKMTDSWSIYKKELDNYLSSKRNTDGIPLSYVIRDNDAALTRAELSALPAGTSEHEKLVKGTLLSGPAWEEDNGVVFALVKQLTFKKPCLVLRVTFSIPTQWERSSAGP